MAIRRWRGQIEEGDSLCLNIKTGRVLAKARPRPKDAVIGYVVSVKNGLVGVKFKPGLELIDE